MTSKRSLLRVMMLGGSLALGLSACGGDEHEGAEAPESVERPEDTGCGIDTWSNYADAFVAGHCTGCHRGFGNYDVLAQKRDTAIRLVDQRRMPKGQRLSDPDRDRFLAWLRCDMPR
jgi:hypothetical protein